MKTFALGIVSTTFSPDLGGLQSQLLSQLEYIDENFQHLRQQHGLSRVVLFLPKRYLSSTPEFKNIAVRFFKFQLSLPGIFFGGFSLRQKIRLAGIDVCHAHNPALEGVMLLGNLGGSKKVISSHGVDLAKFPEFRYGIRNKLWGQAAVKIGLLRVDALVVYSKQMIRFSDGLIDEGKVHVLKYMFDSTKLENWSTTKSPKSDWLRSAIGPNHIVFLTLSGSRRIKGHSNLIKAFSELAPEVPRARLIVGAEGPEIDEAKLLAAQLEIGDKVFFPGFVRGTLKAELFARADVYVNTAFFEPFGIVYLEAALARCGLVASKNGGAAALIEETKSGLIIDPTNIQSILEALRKISEPETRAQIVGAGPHLLEAHTPGLVIEDLFSLYQTLLRKVRN